MHECVLAACTRKREAKRNIIEHSGAFGHIWAHLGAFGYIWEHLGTFGSIWEHLGAKKSSIRAKWSKMEQMEQKGAQTAHLPVLCVIFLIFWGCPLHFQEINT
jgi:hypothetical protein